MKEVPKKGGTLVIDSRNWEKLCKERSRISVTDHVMERSGARRMPLYLWSFPVRWEEPHIVEVVLLFLDEEGNITHRLHRLEYQPFRLEEIMACQKEVGLTEIHTDYHGATNRYEVRAQRPAA